MGRLWALATAALVSALALLLSGWGLDELLTAFSLHFRKVVSGKSGLGPENSWKEMWLLSALLSILLGTPALFLEASEEMELGMASKVGKGGREGASD